MANTAMEWREQLLATPSITSPTHTHPCTSLHASCPMLNYNADKMQSQPEQNNPSEIWPRAHCCIWVKMTLLHSIIPTAFTEVSTSSYWLGNGEMLILLGHTVGCNALLQHVLPHTFLWRDFPKRHIWTSLQVIFHSSRSLKHCFYVRSSCYETHVCYTPLPSYTDTEVLCALCHPH